jgi:transposase InsO family protein
LKHSHFAKQLPAFKELLQQFDGWDRSSFEDSKFSADVVSTVKAIGSQPVRTAFRSPWQNGIAERWVGSVRRDLLDHVIVLNERHLRRLLKDYVRYYHEDRTHLGLEKDTPGGRVAASAPGVSTRLSPCRDSVVCITATRSRPKPPAAMG